MLGRHVFYMTAAVQPVLSKRSGRIVFLPTRDCQLFFACCADLSEAARIERIREALRSCFDWNQVIQLAKRHSLLPLVCHRLYAFRAAIPPETLQTLHQINAANTRRALLLTRELFRTLEHLKSRHILALPYKGPVLAQFLYGDVAMRQTGDLD